MASQFMHMLVHVQRRNPDDVLYGSVVGLEPSISLTLGNVWSFGRQQWFENIVLQATDIVELADSSNSGFAFNQVPPPPPHFLRQQPVQHLPHQPTKVPGQVPGQAAAHAPVQVPVQAPPQVPVHAAIPPTQPTPPAQSAQPTPSKPALVDPAILSFKSRPAALTAAPPVQPAATAAAAVPSQPQPTAPAQNHPALTVRVKNATPPTRSTPVEARTQTAPLVEPMSAQEAKVAVDNAEAQAEAETGTGVAEPATSNTQDGATKSRRRTRGKPSRGRGNANQGGNGERVGVTPQRPKESAGRGKGWRNSPMLEPTPSFQNAGSSRKNGQRALPDYEWASDNANDVQEAGEFDFESNLAKFDKHRLFDQMRLEDTVDDASRLVSHNRNPVPRPGTGGGLNFHPTENVLGVANSTGNLAPPKLLVKKDQAVGTDFWNSEADIATPNTGASANGAGSGGGSNGAATGAGGDRSSGRELGMGSRQSSRRGDSKVSVARKTQTRKASAGTLGQGPSRVNSIAGPSTNMRQSFYTLQSQRRLDTVSALQMINLENIANNELGLTGDMTTENAGRGIAEVALTALNDPAIKIRAGQTSKLNSKVGSKGGSKANGKTSGNNGSLASSTSSLPPSLASSAPTIVVLAGNNMNGTKVVAASRHLRNKGINVLLCVVNIERGNRELPADMQRQILLYRNFGGYVYTKMELFEHLRKTIIPTLTIDTPRSAVLPIKAPVVTLIIDALLGLTVTFDELRPGDRATIYELIEWANRNEAFVLSVDVPSGIDPSTGAVTFVDGAALYVRPRYVVALGAPKRGLLEIFAMAEMAEQAAISGTAHGDDAVLAVASMADEPAHDWRLFVVDIGFGATVWKKAGTKIRRGIDFDDKWVLEMQYRGLDADDSA